MVLSFKRRDLVCQLVAIDCGETFKQFNMVNKTDAGLFKVMCFDYLFNLSRADTVSDGTGFNKS